MLVVALVFSVVFAWRAWRRYPGLAALAAAVATLLAMVLLRNPALAGLGLAGTLWLLYLTESKKRQ